MTHHDNTHTTKTETQKRVFITHAQVLSGKQLESLTEKEKDFERTCQDRGVWLEIFCPNDTCFTEEERVQIPVFCKDPEAGKKIWLNLFCPGDSCEVDEASDLP